LVVEVVRFPGEGCSQEEGIEVRREISLEAFQVVLSLVKVDEGKLTLGRRLFVVVMAVDEVAWVALVPIALLRQT
jgi:hypothetical protein